MPTPSLGATVAAGLLADAADFHRLRRGIAEPGLLQRTWRHFTAGLPADAPGRANTHLALAAAVTRDPALAARAQAALLNNIHHGPAVYVDNDAGCISLSGVHMALSTCLATDWLWPRLNRDQREATISALIAHCAENLTPTPDGIRDENDGRGRLLFARRLDPDDPFCLHPHPWQLNNWDWWFACCLYLIAALAERAFLQPRDGEPELVWGHYHDTGFDLTQARIDRWKGIARGTITRTLDNQLGADGDIGEGIGYANYGGRALVIALTAIDRIDGDDLFSEAVYQLPLWQASQRLGPNHWANFNDTKMSRRPVAETVAALARRSRDPHLQGLLLSYLDEGIDSDSVTELLMLNLDPTLPAEPWQPPRARACARTGTVVWRPDTGHDGFTVALQSGAHGGAHQHCDRNSCILAMAGQPLLVDSGDCRYLPPPGSDFAESQAHTCILIDGQGQTGSNAAPTHGKLIEHQDQGPVSTALLDAGDCYPRARHVYRRAILSRPDFLVLADRVDGPCERLTWLTQGYNADEAAAWRCKPRYVVLKRPELQLYLFFVQPVESAEISQAPLDGEAGGILRLAVTIAGNRCAVVCVPRRNGSPAPVAAWSDGSLTISHAERTLRVEHEAERILIDGHAYSC